MSNDVFTLSQRDLRGIDSNSILRLFDRATEIFNRSTHQLERAKAEKAVQRISRELQKRNVPL